MKVKSLSRVRLLATPWIAAYQAPPSMGFSRQEYWSGVQLPSPIGILGEEKEKRAPNRVMQIFTDINGKPDNNTIVAGDFNTYLNQWTDHSDRKSKIKH